MAKQRKRPSTGLTNRDLGLNHGQAGKGCRPRNCFSEDFRNNYDAINWGRKTRGARNSNA